MSVLDLDLLPVSLFRQNVKRIIFKGGSTEVTCCMQRAFTVDEIKPLRE